MSSVSTRSTKANIDDGFIQVKVVSFDNQNSAIKFKVKRNTPLVKLKKSYCERYSVPIKTYRFYLDGKCLADSDTPHKLKMEDGDIIEVYQEQTAGC